MMRAEKMYSDRIDSLQKEVQKLHIQLDSHNHIERDIKDKNELNMKKIEELQLALHKGQETERKELIEL